jgi:sulfatase maturation enzyme AslB (radical SAM superfamily)
VEFSSFSITVTEECNFNCSYCYQKKGRTYCDIEILESALEFFSPFFAKDCYISFYGGEPLLAFDKIKHAVNYLEKNCRRKNKSFHYSLTTNGSLIDEDVLQFFNQNKFSILVSFDGLAQEIFRKKGSFAPVVSAIEKLLVSPHIDFQTNSVFTPESIGYLAKSIQFIVELGVPNLHLAFSSLSPWDKSSLSLLGKELASLRMFLISFYREKGIIPVLTFRRFPEGIYGCNAGKDRLNLTPDGKLWGCYLVGDYFNRNQDSQDYHQYCFGDLDSFIKDYSRIYPKILSNYSKLRMDYYHTSEKLCMLCDDLESCVVCPMDAALSTAVIGQIPDWKCRMKKVIRHEKKLFWKELEVCKER